jgi:catechol 2,3-dioxygenase-like lactoylglutathione lyase family enzyme
LDHVVIAVGDLEAATDRYSLLLGRRASWRGSHPHFGTVNTLFRLENTYLELLAPAGEGPVARMLTQRLEQEGEGPVALAFGTEDAAECAASLRERGLTASDPTEGRGREQTTGAERHWHNVLLPVSETRGVQLFAIEHHSPAEALPVAEPLAAETSIVTGVDHVVVMTGDAEAARSLYGDKLGLRLALDRAFEARGLRLLFFRIGGITLEIAAQLDAPAETEARDRLWGVAHQVPSVPAARARLAEAGVEVSETRRGQKEGTLVCTVRSGTHGVATLLIGPTEPQKEKAP